MARHWDLEPHGHPEDDAVADVDAADGDHGAEPVQHDAPAAADGGRWGGGCGNV